MIPLERIDCLKCPFKNATRSAVDYGNPLLAQYVDCAKYHCACWVDERCVGEDVIHGHCAFKDIGFIAYLLAKQNQ